MPPPPDETPSALAICETGASGTVGDFMIPLEPVIIGDDGDVGPENELALVLGGVPMYAAIAIDHAASAWCLPFSGALKPTD